MLVVASACSSSTGSTHPETSTSSVEGGSATGRLASRAARLDAAMTAARSSVDGQAYTAAVVSDSGTWSGALGADGTGATMTPQMELALGSITKTFTTAEILHLADAGKVDLDAPTARYVTSPLTANGATVRQTLSMTSGIRDGSMVSGFDDAVSDTPDRVATPDQELAYATTTTAAIGPPGEYSNAGFMLLGLVIERVTGVSYAVAIRRDLLAPAGLDRVAVQTDERPTAPVAYPIGSGERPVTDGWLPDRAVSGAAGAAGSIAADAPDVARWGYDLYSARTVVSAADVSAMTTPVALQNTYGLGTVTALNAEVDVPNVGHDGAISRTTSSGQEAWYTSEMLIVPDQHVSVVVLAPSEATASSLDHLVAALFRAAGGH